MKTAVERAIKGGWDPISSLGDGESSNIEYIIESTMFFIDTKYALLDPSFWRALAKAEGWDEYTDFCKSGCGCERNQNGAYHEYDCIWESKRPDSTEYWHRFVDHLIEGKDVDSFFNNLLK